MKGACSARALFIAAIVEEARPAFRPPRFQDLGWKLARRFFLHRLRPGAARRPPRAAADGADVELQLGDGAAQSIAVHPQFAGSFALIAVVLLQHAQQEALLELAYGLGIQNAALVHLHHQRFQLVLHSNPSHLAPANATPAHLHLNAAQHAARARPACVTWPALHKTVRALAPARSKWRHAPAPGKKAPPGNSPITRNWGQTPPSRASPPRPRVHYAPTQTPRPEYGQTSAIPLA